MKKSIFIGLLFVFLMLTCCSNVSINTKTIDDQYASDILRNIMATSDQDGLCYYMCPGEKVYSEDVPLRFKKSNIYSAFPDLFEDRRVQLDDDWDTYRYVDADSVQEHLNMMYGQDVKDDFDSFSANGYGMEYDAETGEYWGYVAAGGMNPRDFVYEYSYNELKNDILQIYARVAYVNCDDYYNKIVSLYSSPDKTEDSYITTLTVENVQRFTVDSYLLQEKGLKYLFSFNKSPDGSYYWVSSEPVK
ncbi:MAG: hypothetical protein IJE51_03065 [Clostridia bacterium]|nr:hypothetical protein [Clostridia bacterium]